VEKKKTIYLHVGTTKTGSTSIQTLLRENQELLRQKGFAAYTPCRLGGADNPYRMRGVAEYLSLFSTRLPSSRKRVEWFEHFLVGLKNQTADRIILSEECLWNVIGSRRKRRVFSKLIRELHTFADVKVLVYLRRQDNHLMSAYQQSLKGGRMGGLTCRQYLRMMPDGGLRADYGRCLKWLWGRMGKESLIVRVFEPEQFDRGSLLADFLSQVGLDLDDGFHVPEERRNPGISPFLAEIIRCLGFFYAQKTLIRPFLRLKWVEDGRYRKQGLEHQFLSPADRRRLMETYKAGNQWVARELLGRDDGILFYDPLPPRDDAWDEYQLNEEEVRAFFDEGSPLRLPQEQRQKMCEQVVSVVNGKLSRRTLLVSRLTVCTKRLQQKFSGLAGV